MAAAGGRQATNPRHHSILYYILYIRQEIVCYTMSISLGTCIFFFVIIGFFFCAHTYLRPLDLEEGDLGCLLPWQRDDIAARCCGIRAGVRQRRHGNCLTLVGEVHLADKWFQLAESNARAHVASNFVKGITSVTDHPGSTKPEKKAKHAQHRQEAAMEFAAGRLINKDG